MEPVDDVSPVTSRDDVAPLTTPLRPVSSPRPLHRAASDVANRQLRHRREIPMILVSSLITVGAFVYWVSLIETDREVTGLAAFVPLILLAPFVLAVLIRFNYWQVIGDAVEVTENQFGDLFAQYSDVAAEMGLEKLPRLYLANGNGVLNAFAAKCTVRRSFVVIYSDLLDLMYEHGDVNGVRFILAHELGHVKLKHVAIWRFVVNVIPDYLWIGRSVTRAQEYSADRCAMHYAPEGASSMMALYAGKRLYRRVDPVAYFASFDDHKIGFWGPARASNLVSTHPQGHRRMRALWAMQSEGLDHHGKML